MNCNRKSASWLTGAKQRGTLYFLENLAYFSERGDKFFFFEFKDYSGLREEL